MLARHRRRAADRQGRARRADPAGNGQRRRATATTSSSRSTRRSRRRPSRCWPESAKPTRRRGRPRSSWTRAARRSWRWRTGRRSTPTDLSEAEPEDLLNRATGFTYEPGSTFKAFTVAAALEEKLVTPDTAFTLAPSIQVADRDDRGVARARRPETLTVAEILAQSSNVGAVTIGLELGAEQFSRWIDRFGFGRPDRRPVPRRGAGDRARRSTNTPARRWATCRSARASR